MNVINLGYRPVPIEMEMILRSYYDNKQKEQNVNSFRMNIFCEKIYLSQAMASKCKIDAVQQSKSQVVHISHNVAPNIHSPLIWNTKQKLIK